MKQINIRADNISMAPCVILPDKSYKILINYYYLNSDNKKQKSPMIAQFVRNNNSEDVCVR